MLIYHPAQDVNHCVYRICAILISVNSQELSLDQLRVLDFYYLFPSEIKKIKPWPALLKGQLRKVAFSIDDCFESLDNRSRVFYDLLHFQKNAVLELASKGVVDKEVFESGRVQLISGSLPAKFERLIASDEFIKSDVFRLIVNELPKLEMSGANGLKKRSGLMEYVYDPA